MGNRNDLYHDPYIQRRMKIIRAENASEAEAIVNALFSEVDINGGIYPDVRVTPSTSGDGYTIIIFSDCYVD